VIALKWHQDQMGSRGEKWCGTCKVACCPQTN